MDRFPVPFAGLGFDLSPLEARAALLDLVPEALPRCAPPAQTGLPEMVPAPAGYRLLVRLSRETRGR